MLSCMLQMNNIVIARLSSQCLKVYCTGSSHFHERVPNLGGPHFHMTPGAKYKCLPWIEMLIVGVGVNLHTQSITKQLQGPFYSQLDNKSYDHTIMKLSDQSS